MQLTNNLNLPAPLVQALSRDSGSFVQAPNEFRVTELLSPPRAAVLKKKHDAEIVEDVSDNIWRVLGQAFHKVMEDNEKRWSVIAEKRLRIERQGHIISGQFDSFDVLMSDDSYGLVDYKLTSVYRLLMGSGIEEWTPQLNIYRYMLESTGAQVKALHVCAALRDWSKSDARRDRDYPQKQLAMVPIEVWSNDKVEEFLDQRLALHIAARSGNLPDCTPHERWQRPPKFAIRKDGNQRAVKLCDTAEEAQSYGSARKMWDGTKWLKPYYLEHRPPVSIRCQDYCAAAPFCSQWAADPTNVQAEIQKVYNG